MFAIALLAVYAAYLLGWIAIVVIAWRLSRRFIESKVVASIFAMAAFFVGFWPAFGDYYPTMHKYKQLCASDAGFKVLVTPEEWKKENPGVLENLVPYKKFVEREYPTLGEVVLGNNRIGGKTIGADLLGGSIKKWKPDTMMLKRKKF